MQFETCNIRVFQIALAHATSGWVEYYKKNCISLFSFHILNKKFLVRTRLELCFVGLHYSVLFRSWQIFTVESAAA